MKSTAFISHPDTLLHVMDGHHPESPARITAIKERLTATGLYSRLQIHEAPLATDAQLTRAHTPAYVQRIRAIAPSRTFHRWRPRWCEGASVQCCFAALHSTFARGAMIPARLAAAVDRGAGARGLETRPTEDLQT